MQCVLVIMDWKCSLLDAALLGATVDAKSNINKINHNTFLDSCPLRLKCPEETLMGLMKAAVGNDTRFTSQHIVPF